MGSTSEVREINRFHIQLLENALICLDLVQSNIDDYAYIADVKRFLSELTLYLDENMDFTDEAVKLAFVQKIVSPDQNNSRASDPDGDAPTAIDRLFMFEARMHAWPTGFASTKYSADAILVSANIFRLSCSLAGISIARPSLFHIYDDSLKSQKEFIVTENKDSLSVELDPNIKSRLTRNFLKQGNVDTESRIIVDCHKIGVTFNGVSIRPMVLLTKPLYELLL